MDSKPCHHVSGECSNGCKDGYIGYPCTDGKKYSILVTKVLQIGNKQKVVCSRN